MNKPTHAQFCKLASELMRFDEVEGVQEFLDTEMDSFVKVERLANKLKQPLREFNRFEISDYIKRLILNERSVAQEIVHFIEYDKNFWLDKQSLSLNIN